MKSDYKFRITILVILFWYCFTNAQVNSNIEWQKVLGGTGYDKGLSIIKTLDEGYIVAGFTTSDNNGDVVGNHGLFDCWIIKLSQSGNISWKKTIGGTSNDLALSIIEAFDGGYVLVGRTSSNDGDIIGYEDSIYNHILVVKLSSIGNIEWLKKIGGNYNNTADSICQTLDGGLIVTGVIDAISNLGSFRDLLVLKLNNSGDIEWQQTFGGSADEFNRSVASTPDGGCIILGGTISTDGDVTNNNGSYDFWVIKLNNLGNIEWQKTYGGSDFDFPKSIIKTSDGGYIVAGSTDSDDGDITEYRGWTDAWVVKLDNIGNIEWQKTYGGNVTDNINSIYQTNDNGYILAGLSNSTDLGIINSNYRSGWILKLSPFGVVEWQGQLGGNDNEELYSILQTNEGGYITTGYTSSNNGDVTGNHGFDDLWILKINENYLSNNLFLENSNLTLFPNPAKENITLKLNYFSPSQEISITDIQGKIIHNQKLEGLSTTINTSIFEKGIYFLNIVDGTQKTTKKFIVE